MLGRVVAFTLRGCSAFSVKYGMNPLTVIHDFNTGKEKNKRSKSIILKLSIHSSRCLNRVHVILI